MLPTLVRLQHGRRELVITRVFLSIVSCCEARRFLNITRDFSSTETHRIPNKVKIDNVVRWRYSANLGYDIVSQYDFMTQLGSSIEAIVEGMCRNNF